MSGGVRNLQFLADEARQSPIDDFAQRFPCPYLIVDRDAEEDGSDDATFQTMTARSQATTKQTTNRGLRLEAIVLPVEKKARGKFSNMISVGRTSSNDVSVDHSSVSKFHAYFIKKGIQNGPESWFIQDANSSNGTFVNGQRIVPGVPIEVLDGMTVQFSADTRYRFFSAMGLYRYLRETMAEGS